MQKSWKACALNIGKLVHWTFSLFHIHSRNCRFLGVVNGESTRHELDFFFFFFFWIRNFFSAQSQNSLGALVSWKIPLAAARNMGRVVSFVNDCFWKTKTTPCQFFLFLFLPCVGGSLFFLAWVSFALRCPIRFFGAANNFLNCIKLPRDEWRRVCVMSRALLNVTILLRNPVLCL